MPAKGKGSGYERDMCRCFSLWWSNGKRDDIFWRTSNSGGRATVRDRVGKDTFGQCGDIQATDPVGQPFLDCFTIELKRGYNSANVIDMLNKKEGAAEQKWEGFYSQVLGDAVRAQSLSWMLVWRTDRRDALVYIPNSIANRIIIVQGLRRHSGHLNSIPCLKGRLLLKSGAKVFPFICRLEDFLDAVNPNNIRRVLHDNAR
jgi:hypothetical protein